MYVYFHAISPPPVFVVLHTTLVIRTLNLQRSRRLEHEELSNEERLLNRELEVLAKHFQSWDLQAAPAPSIHTGECQSSPCSSGNAAHREIESLSYG